MTAGASCRIQTFAGHLIPTMIGRIRLRCPPSSDAIPPLGHVVPHGLIEIIPHLGTHADAHCCMAFGRLFVAFLEAQVGNHPFEVAGEVQKILTATGVACGWGRTTHRTGRRPTSCSLFGSKLRPCLLTSRTTPRGKQLWGCEHCYALCTRQFRLCQALRADVLLLRFGNIAAGSRGRTICCSWKRIVIQWSRVRTHAGWDWLPCRGTLWRHQ